MRQRKTIFVLYTCTHTHTHNDLTLTVTQQMVTCTHIGHESEHDCADRESDVNADVVGSGWRTLLRPLLRPDTQRNYYRESERKEAEEK